jgi:hypothetical protein
MKAQRQDVSRVLEWLDELPIKIQDKCAVRIKRLQVFGHDLRRPESDYFRDGIYELLVRYRADNYQGNRSPL